MVSNLVYVCSVFPSEKYRKKEEKKDLPLLAGAHTDIWLEREDLGTSQLLCPGKMFRQGN